MFEKLFKNFFSSSQKQPKLKDLEQANQNYCDCIEKQNDDIDSILEALHATNGNLSDVEKFLELLAHYPEPLQNNSSISDIEKLIKEREIHHAKVLKASENLIQGSYFTVSNKVIN